MADTQTKISIVYRQNNQQNIHATLDALIRKAEKLKNLLGSLDMGGGGGGNGFAVPGSGTSSSLASSLPMAQRAKAGTTANIVTGGSSTQRGGNESWAQFPSYDFGSRFERGRVTSWAFDEKNRMPPAMLAPEFRAAEQNRNRAIDRAQNFQSRQAGGTPWADTVFEGRAGWESESRYPTDDFFDPSEMAEVQKFGSRIGPRRSAFSRKMSGRMGYGVGLVGGLMIHGASSQYNRYWSTSFSAQPVVAAGMYSGDYFQMLQSQREAQAIRQTAGVQAWTGAGSTIGAGAISFGTMLMMAPAWQAKLAGAGIAVAGGTVNSISGYFGSKSQAAIDAETARISAGLSTGQRMQNATADAMAAALPAILYAGQDGFKRMSQIDAMRLLGAERGFGPRESIEKTMAFLRAGGRFGSASTNRTGRALELGWGPSGIGGGLSEGTIAISRDTSLASRIFELERDYGITPETAGLAERGLLPGGGIRGASTSSYMHESLGSQWMDRTIGVAQRMGVGPQRMNEFVQRSAMLEQQYAERGVETKYGVGSWVANTFNPQMQGMTAIAAAESMRNMGLSLGDQLTESMMPKRLADALVMTRVIGEGGGPLDWSKKLFDQAYMRKQYNKTGSIVPDMLRPFFDAQVTGTVPEFADTRIYSNVVPKPEEPTSEGATDLEKAAKLQAEADNMVIRNWYEAIATMTDKLNTLSTAIENATFDVAHGGAHGGAATTGAN